jgi:hypothetical protein
MFPFRVFVSSPKVVELESVLRGFVEFVMLNTLKISHRGCSETPVFSFVVSNTETSTVLNPGP